MDDVTDWVGDFSPAVIQDTAERAVAERFPEWFVLRYVAGREKLLIRLLDFIGIPFKHLTYHQRLSRRESHTCAWLPGYMFLEFDARRDNWGQVLRMPAALEVLGSPSPLPAGVVEDLALRLPQWLAKPSEIACVAPGMRVKIKAGSFEDHEGPVIWADRKEVKIMLMLFNRPTEVKVNFGDVEIV